MGYLDQLRASEAGKPATSVTDKTDKTPFVSFGSAPDSPVSMIPQQFTPGKEALRVTDKTDKTPTGAEREEIRRHLVRLLPGEDHPDYGEAFAQALDYPGALECLRLSCPPKGAE